MGRKAKENPPQPMPSSLKIVNGTNFDSLGKFLVKHGYTLDQFSTFPILEVEIMTGKRVEIPENKEAPRIVKLFVKLGTDDKRECHLVTVPPHGEQHLFYNAYFDSKGKEHKRPELRSFGNPIGDITKAIEYAKLHGIKTEFLGPVQPLDEPPGLP